MQNMTCYQPFQKLYPLSLLSKSVERQYRGGLQVYDGSVTWLVYLEVGGPLYATNSIEPFERLDRHLCNLTPQVPTSVMRGQIRWLFGAPQNAPSDCLSDYQAICWLVQNHYLNTEQAAQLVEAISKEAIDTLLAVREGTYQFIELPEIAKLPKFCRFNLNDLVKKSPDTPSDTPISPPKLGLTDAPGPSLASPQLFLEPHRLSPSTGISSPPSTHEIANPTKVPAPSPVKPATPTPTPKTTEGETTPNIYKIACIDDNPSIIRAISSFLDEKEFSVLSIHDPVKALMQIVRSKPHLILLDVEMPKLDGYELCSLLRRHPSFKQTPIVMVTANTGFLDRAKAKLVRASDYMTKPFTKSELIEMVRKHLP